MNAIDHCIEQAEKILTDNSESDYIGENVTQLEHAIQCGYFAKKHKHTPEVIVASIFHDIGHYYCNLHRPTMADLGVIFHEWIGGRVLREIGFTKKTSSLIRYHVAAKRYLSAKKPTYTRKLSLASKGTLNFQGGPMNSYEIDNFEIHPWFKEIIQVRANDENGKIEDFNYPDFNYFKHEIKYCLDQNIINNKKDTTSITLINLDGNEKISPNEIISKANIKEHNIENLIIIVSDDILIEPTKISSLDSQMEGVLYIDPFLSQTISQKDINTFLTKISASKINNYVIISRASQINHIYKTAIGMGNIILSHQKK